MLRTTQRLTSSRQQIAWQLIRNQSQYGGQSKKSGGIPTAALVAVGGVTTGFGGVLGYAAWSDENRKLVDDSIPGIQYVTDALLGQPVRSIPIPAKPSSPRALVSKPPSSTLSPPSKETTKKEESANRQTNLNEKKTEEKKEEKDTTNNVIKAGGGAPDQSASPPSTAQKKEVSPPTVVALNLATSEANKSVTAALEAAEEAAEAVHKQVMAAVKDLGGEAGVSETIKTAVGAAITGAEDSLDKAALCLSKLSVAIKAIQADGSPSSDSLAIAEETANELSPALNKIKNVLSDSINSMLTFETLSDALREARATMASELNDLFPGASSLDPEKQVQLMLGQAFLRISALHKNIMEKQRVIEELREKGHTSLDADLQAELDYLRHQLTLQHKSDLSRQKEELEAEVRGQLKRQAAAHSEHLGDMLGRKELEVTKAWQAKLFDDIIKEKDRHLKEIAGVKGKVQGLRSAVDARANADKMAYGARRLWLACNSLYNIIRLGKEGASDYSDQLQPIDTHLAAIAVAGVEDEFVKVLVGSLCDSVAAERGVYTEQALRYRFEKVALVAQRVALVPENGGSLLRYLLSYVQSLLIVRATPKDSEAMLFDSPFDVDSLNTFDIIDRARISLAANDLTTCIRWLNQLTGESRNVARDWCTEARRTLEAKQAAEALMAHAASVTAGAC